MFILYSFLFHSAKMALKTCINGILLFCACFSSIKGDDPIVETTYGKISGHILTSAEGKEYYAYQEVPFASPPTEKLRFKEAVPPENWEGILSTTENTKVCYQAKNSVPEGLKESEDCLYLNVYTPKKPGENPDQLLPVLFWIHGGAFVLGDGTFLTYSPKCLMDYDIIVVSINYRLGPFGFLTTEDGVIPANLGLRDQNFALKWVQSNIKNFGGDPTKVTIVGESAGAVSVGFQLLSKQSEGLFRAAILESGTAIASFARQRWAKYWAFEYASTLDSKFVSNSSTDLLEFLQGLSADDLNKITITVPIEKQNGVGSHGDRVWCPVIEDDNLDDTFYAGLMHEDLKEGNVNKVPVMLGFNSEEELAFISYDVDKEAKRFDDKLELLINNKFDLSEKDKKAAAAEFREIYSNETFESNPGSIVKYLSDECFSTPAARQAYLQCGYTDVYVYEFSHKGELGGGKTIVNGAETVGHAEELHYLWEIQGDPDSSDLTISDNLTRKRLLKLWTNFVKYLNPTPEDDPLLDSITWPKVSMDIKHEIAFLNINSTLEVQTDPKHYKEFARIIDKYVEDPIATY